MRGEATIRINAAPKRLWEMVSDVTRMGLWSPETRRCEWLDGATGPKVGARFRGYNKRGLMQWSTVSTVTAADVGREFAFETGENGMRWRYQFNPSDGETAVTESYEMSTSPAVLRIFFTLIGRQKQLDRGIRRTLQRLKIAAEAD